MSILFITSGRWRGKEKVKKIVDKCKKKNIIKLINGEVMVKRNGQKNQTNSDEKILAAIFLCPGWGCLSKTTELSVHPARVFYLGRMI